VIQRAKQVMGQIEKHSKIALGLREGAQLQKSRVNKFELNCFLIISGAKDYTLLRSEKIAKWRDSF